MKKVRTGLDILRDGGFLPLRGKRFALLAHAGSVDANLEHALDLLYASDTGTFVRVFGPEHGLRGAVEYMAGVHSSCDAQTGVPVVSLYDGTYESLTPKPSDLSDIDVLVVDLPDVGSRFYTYAQTMAFAMRTCGELGVRVIVLDRPNPINGVSIEGAPLIRSCRSFCGYTPIPNRHGLTLGELARLYQAGFGTGDDRQAAISCDLEVITCDGWARESYFSDTGLPWVLPSPNIPNLESAMIYPGGCLFEGTNLSEGRGTTKPFEFVGAPFIRSEEWRDAALQQGLALHGVKLRPISFLPKFEKWAGQECYGLQIHITDHESFQPFRLALALIYSARRLYPTEFSWRTTPYEFVTDVPAIDLLYGTPQFRIAADSGSSLVELEHELLKVETSFATARRDFILQ